MTLAELSAQRQNRFDRFQLLCAELDDIHQEQELAQLLPSFGTHRLRAGLDADERETWEAIAELAMLG